MNRTELLQEVRQMRFEEVYKGWRERRLTQEEAARVLGVCDRTFRRLIGRYGDDGTEGLKDKRLANASARRAPVDEVLEMTSLYKSRYQGWSVKHFHAHYRRSEGKRSYTWVKSNLQTAGLVPKIKKTGGAPQTP